VYENNNKSNRLITVTDTSQNYNGYPDTSGNTISYDLNGNMITHKDKGILQIDYNFLNLPKFLKFDQLYFTRGTWLNTNTTNYYKADGSKIRKEHRYSENSSYKLKTTEYLDGFQYEVKSTSVSTAPLLKFIPTSEGYFNFENNKYIYNYADHLGNVRLSYFHNGSSIEVLEENNYYPFGLKHEGYNPTAGNPAYQYKYNGKELQAETGMYDYGARFYMPDIGRWGVVDPLAEKYRRHSTYSYAVNNPIRFIDPDGMQVSPVLEKMQNTISAEDGEDKYLFKNKKGETVKTVTVNTGDDTPNRLFVQDPNANESTKNRKEFRRGYFVMKMIPSSGYSEEDYQAQLDLDLNSQFDLDRNSYIWGDGVEYTDNAWYDRLKESLSDDPVTIDDIETVIERRGSLKWGNEAEHKKGAKKSTKETHEKGDGRKKRDKEGEKKDNPKQMPYRRK
jgi:RHS repeat-associated protein